MDLRTDQTTLKGLSQEGFKPIEQMEEKAVAKEMKLVSFVECSGMQQIGITEMFDLAVTTGLKQTQKGLRKDSVFYSKLQSVIYDRNCYSKIGFGNDEWNDVFAFLPSAPIVANSFFCANGELHSLSGRTHLNH
jgi:hypothetical protein